MMPGDLIADRYYVERLGGSGGMGKVYLAHDGAGAKVAIKVLHAVAEEARFRREAQVLSGLQHPGIVRYIDQGTTATGEAYLITEWVEGETLAERVKRGPLSVEEGLLLGRLVAEALGAAHLQGVVHRDVKPSNLFLVGGDLGDVRVLDFGIARAQGGEGSLTMTGVMLGTFGYMSPEQARGERRVDARADVFSLACVLFKCLAGRAVFVGEDMISLLLKVVMEEAPRLSDHCVGVPRALDTLLARMLAKEPDARPRDGAAVAEALAAIDESGRDSQALSAASRRDLATNERKVMSLVVVRGVTAPGVDRTTISPSELESQDRAVRLAKRQWQGRVDHLADGSMVITMTSAEAATDLAAQAARCALALRPHLDAPVVVVSGVGETFVRVPVGELIDRAAALLALAPTGAVRLDAVTAGLLDAGFDVERDDAGIVLRGERDPSDTTPRLLGRATPCVGRERELSQLDATYAECVEDSVARAVLVIGEPGMGKSRLRQEFMRRIRRRDEGVEPWLGRGDAMSRGSAFCLLAQALRRATGVADGELPSERRRQLEAGVARHVPAASVRRVTEFLGELIDAPVPDAEASAELRAARHDPLALGEQMRKAVEAFLLAESAARPVVIVLEDLHWGDLPTVSFIDEALRALADRPFLVLALARPEVHSVFPRLWADREIQEIRLSKLTRRVSERLARQVLGEERSAATIDAIVERANGNAFYLEELIRAEVERPGGELPETVLAMVQSRLEGMEAGARRVLRAASVFGRTFWHGGVATLLDAPLADEWLAALAEREVISPPRETRFPGEVEHTFRHAIVHESAYAMLTPDDQALAHGLAGAWLEAAGETDAMVMAQHFERGGEPARAAACCMRAAEQALRGNDLAAALDLGMRGLKLGAVGEVRASLEATLLEACAWSDDWAAAATHAEEIFRREPPGTRPWCMAAMGKVWAGPTLDRYDSLLEAVNALRDVEPAEGARPSLVHALGAVVTTLLIAGMYELAGVYLARMEHVGAPIEAEDPFARGWMEQARGFWYGRVDDDPFRSLLRMRASAEAFTAGHQRQQAMFSEVQAAIEASHLGARAEALAMLGPALAEPSSTMRHGSADPASAARPGDGPKLRLVALVATFALALVKADEGLLEEAEADAARAIGAARAQGNRFMEGHSRIVLAIVFRRRGELDAAAEQALSGASLLSNCPADRAQGLAVLSGIRLDQGRSAEALALAREIYPVAACAPAYTTGLILLAWVEALAAVGDAGAKAALAGARDEILARARKIPDLALRTSYLEQIPQNARILALAERLG